MFLLLMDIIFKGRLYFWVLHSLKSNWDTQCVSCIMSSCDILVKKEQHFTHCKRQRKTTLPFYIVLCEAKILVPLRNVYLKLFLICYCHFCGTK